MQVAGPYDILGGIRRALPKTLKILDGETLPIEWYLHDELPVTPPNAAGKPLAYPNGTFRILPPVQPRNAVSADANEPYRMEPTQRADTIAYATGTLLYEVTEQDIASVVSVTGTRLGVPHTFVDGTDFTWDRKSFTWTGTGNLPDNGTNVVYTYRHRMYYPRRVMDSRYTVRALLRCQAHQVEDGRHYSMSRLAAVLGSSLEMELRARAASRIVEPGSPDDRPYEETATIARVISAGPLPMDSSGSVALWFVDFTVSVAGIYEETAVQSILEAPFEVDLEQ